MWHKHGKKVGILLFIAINTIAIILLIGYGKRSGFAYSERITEEKKDRTLKIYNVDDYLTFANSVNEENDYAHWEVVLCEDLDFSGYDNVPVIGETSESEEAVIFRGKFEGDGHKISNLHISNPDGNAAMFARFGGIVKNLQIENCSFYGKISGAITAESYEADILNCYVNAETTGEVAGTIAGRLFGKIINCVTSSEAIGEVQYGGADNCYILGHEDVIALNDRLYYISGLYKDAYFYRWKKTDVCMLSDEREDLLDTLTARLIIGDKEFSINGFYSNVDAQWYVTLPAAYQNVELYLEARTSNGGYEVFRRNPGEDTVIFTWKDKYYPIHFISADNIESLYITLEKHRSLDYVHANKIEEIPGVLQISDKDGKFESVRLKGFYGHGNDSWEADKKSYNLKLASNYDLLGMGENEDFVLLAGYRMNSLMSYVTSAELTREIGFDYAPEFRLVNLYVNGEYVGVYFLTEKIEIDKNRIEIINLYEKTKEVNHGYLKNFTYEMYLNEETKEKGYYYTIENNPDDITGGYLLELDVADYGEEVSRFITKERKNKVTLKRATYSSEEQVKYIAKYWQEFEDALLSSTGENSQGKRYTEYIDLESFAMQWLLYELAQEDSMKSSIYYYKESEIDGDGLLHACYPWDLERSYCNLEQLNEFWNVHMQGEYWQAFYQHEDFREEVSRVWEKKLLPAVELMIAQESVETESGFKNLSWYEKQLKQINYIENIRWNESDMLEKCETIRYILSVRKDVLTSIFAI